MRLVGDDVECGFASSLNLVNWVKLNMYAFSIMLSEIILNEYAIQ